MSALAMIIPILAIALFATLVVGGTVLWIWMLVDCATKEPDEGNTKIIWILIILLTHLLGALLYFFIRRPERKREFGR